MADGSVKRHRPNAAERWVNCPGSVSAEEAIPDDESDAAREGTACAELGALVCGMPRDTDNPRELVGQLASNNVAFDSDMAEAILMYQEEVSSWKCPGPPFIEQTFDSVEMPSFGGTPDAAAAYNMDGNTHKLYVGDLKYGWGIVDVKENWQLISYAILIIEGMLANGGKPEFITEIEFVIVQPRPAHIDGRVRRWVISYNDLMTNYKPRLENAIRVSMLPGASCISGSWCLHCKAVRTCESARQAGLAAMEVSTINAMRPLSPEELGNELRLLKAAAERIKTRLKALDAEATERLKKNEVIPGYSLRAAEGNRRWIPGKNVKPLEALTGKKISKDDAYITPLQAHKLGIPWALINRYSEVPSKGVKLIEKDLTEKAKEILANGK